MMKHLETTAIVLLAVTELIFQQRERQFGIPANISTTGWNFRRERRRKSRE
jgi:hypothetical protein